MKLADLGMASYDVRMLARLSAVFTLSAASTACVEIFLWRSESLIALFLPFLVWILASLRVFPRRTATRKAFSAGIFVGMCIPLALL
jgi:hypothetical protein